jgi:hypothetical protein
MTPRTVTEWFELVTLREDLDLVRKAIRELDSPDWPPIDGPREEHLLALLTAIRLDQMARENR